jgi:hypothetical protein
LKMKRRAIPSDEKGQRDFVAKVIDVDTISDSGKAAPASLGGSGIKDLTLKEDEDEMIEEGEEGEESVSKSIYVPLLKANNEERTVTGVVLQPEVVDAQGDIMSADVIRKAAHRFLSKYNKATKLGLMHKYFGNLGFELYESWIAPQSVVINGTTVKEGSWIMTVYVSSDKIWKLVKSGKLTGFSIGGKARAKKISNANEVSNG